jgi:hypothetical protein
MYIYIHIYIYNAGLHKSWAFGRSLALNICGPSVWDFFIVILLAPRFLRLRLYFFKNLFTPDIVGGPLMVAQWLMYYATNPKVAGSIPDGVVGIFH